MIVSLFRTVVRRQGCLKCLDLTKKTLVPSRTSTSYGLKDSLQPSEKSKEISAIVTEMEDTSMFDREFVDMTVDDFKDLFKHDLSGDTRAKIEVILKEYEYLKYNTMGKVPSSISSEQMLSILTDGETSFLREKHLNFLYKREMVKRAGLLKRARDKVANAKVLAEKVAKIDRKTGGVRTGLLTSPEGDLVYGLWHNSLFPRLHEDRLRVGTSAGRLIQASMFGPKLVFDFDFEKYMVPWLNRNAIEQVQVAYGLNRFHYYQPFDLWFCNLPENSNSYKYLTNNAMRSLDRNTMVTVKSDCFTNHFDRSKLVYLSPDAKQTLDSVGTNDDVYIIGMFNDKGIAKPLTLRKAESLGIRCRRLPIDNHVAWSLGSKSLCINHVVGVMLDVLNGGSWAQAFHKHVPSRKIKPMEVIIEEEKLRTSRYNEKKSHKFYKRNHQEFR